MSLSTSCFKLGVRPLGIMVFKVFIHWSSFRSRSAGSWKSSSIVIVASSKLCPGLEKCLWRGIGHEKWSCTINFRFSLVCMIRSKGSLASWYNFVTPDFSVTNMW